MHKIDFPVSFIARGTGSKDDRAFYYLSALAQDGNVDRFYVSQDIYKSLDACILGDKLSVSARIFYVPTARAWNMKIDSINPTI